MRASWACVAVALASFGIGACTTLPACKTVVPIAEILSTPAEFSGKELTIEATVRDTGVHGMFIHDPQDVTKGLNLRMEPQLAQSDVAMKMTKMLLVDRKRERRLGVVARWTGTFIWRPDALSTFAASKIRNLHWGNGLDR